MECNMCLENYDEGEHKPMVLECGHTFCQACIQDLYKTPKRECPLDRKSLSHDYQSIQTNYSLLEVISSFKLIAKNSKKKPEKQPKKIIRRKKCRAKNSPNLSASSNELLLCQNSHSLVKYSDIKERNRLAGKDENQIRFCSHCHISGLTQTRACLKCNFDLCENCKTEQLQAIKITSAAYTECLKGHPLFYYKNIDLFYLRKTSNFSFICCNKCNRLYNGNSTSCRICSFNICNKCMNIDLNVINQMPDPALVITCVKGHALKNPANDLELEILLIDEPFVCNGCEQTYISCFKYFCGFCDFDLCEECHDTIVNYQKFGKIMKCQNSHDLAWHNDTVRYYNIPYVCDLCSYGFDACGSFHCRICDFDICIRCVRGYINIS